MAAEVSTLTPRLGGSRKPETHDSHQVCVRCDAYRDRGQAAERR
jgi:hypothetical protein